MKKGLLKPLNYYLFLAPRDVKKFKTQRQSARPSEIAANVIIQTPRTDKPVAPSPVAKKMLEANVLKPAPTPVAIPEIPLVKIEIISLTKAVPSTIPYPPYIVFCFFSYL